jgi:hypothetical protein
MGVSKVGVSVVGSVISGSVWGVCTIGDEGARIGNAIARPKEMRPMLAGIM